MTHALANIGFLVVLALSVGILFADLEADWPRIRKALGGRSIR